MFLEFHGFLQDIKNADTNFETEEEFYSFYVNVYNAFVINIIIENACKQDIFGKCGTIQSIRNIGSLIHSVWDTPAGTIGTKSYSLDDIEDILRFPKDVIFLFLYFNIFIILFFFFFFFFLFKW